MPRKKERKATTEGEKKRYRLKVARSAKPCTQQRAQATATRTPARAWTTTEATTAVQRQSNQQQQQKKKKKKKRAGGGDKCTT